MDAKMLVEVKGYLTAVLIHEPCLCQRVNGDVSLELTIFDIDGIDVVEHLVSTINNQGVVGQTLDGARYKCTVALVLAAGYADEDYQAIV